MTMQAMVVLVVGYLSFGPALEQVAITRSTKPTYYPLEAAAVEQYDCYAGLPHGLGYLIGAEVYFVEAVTNQVYGPILVVDVEQWNHRGELQRASLAADVWCKDGEQLTHKLGAIVLLSEVY